MKSFQYNAKGILSFSHDKQDYTINGKGPHLLPEESPLVKSLISQGILTEPTKKNSNTIKN
ncbi:MAG: hypothetical protein J7577_13305 [Sphingobacteriaceae bacterium]|nr:hypothetical protein [Sphingobacteriaceae bacterium]